MRTLALVLMLSLTAVAAAYADGNALLRLHYSPYAAGTILKSPADPDGKKRGEAVDDTWKGDLELIVWGRLGISGTRQNVRREYNNSAGQAVHEEWAQYSYNLSLYLRRAGHDRFNVFAGAGTGSVERYRYSLDKVRLDEKSRHANMPLSRAFGGIDYTFERIGFRYEFSSVQVENVTGDFKDKLNQNYQHIGFYIPFN